jgi:hypothetical protein
MNETIDQLIAARFDAVANRTDDGEWCDVLARARSVPPARRKPRFGRARSTAPIRFALGGTVIVFALAASAAAFGWPGTVVDFFKARPAPESVSAFFRTHNAELPRGVSPQAKLGRPREVMTATFDANNLPATDPTVHTLYVASTAAGGFCYLWTDYGGGCVDAEDASTATTNPAARPLGVEWLAQDYAGFADGWARSDVQTVEARFADGTDVTLPVTWVSAPINAGFFAYVVPAAHQTTADALSSVVGLDANGKVIGEDDIGVTQPLDEDVLQTLPDGTKYSLPRRAEAARARKVVSFRTTNGARAYLWVMPRTGGGSCYLFGTGAGGGQGCTSPYRLSREPALNGGVVGNGRLYFAQVKPDIATLELRLQGGRTERLTPVAGFVLAELRGRLVSAVGLGSNGAVLATQHLRP